MHKNRKIERILIIDKILFEMGYEIPIPFQIGTHIQILDNAPLQVIGIGQILDGAPLRIGSGVKPHKKLQIKKIEKFALFQFGSGTKYFNSRGVIHCFDETGLTWQFPLTFIHEFFDYEHFK